MKTGFKCFRDAAPFLAVSLLVAGSGCSKPMALEPNGVSNRVLLLDGKSAMLVKGRPSLQEFTNAITMELWFKAASFYPNDGAVNCLLRKNVTAGAENFFLRFRTYQVKPMVEMCPSLRVGILQASYAFKIGQWYHLAGTYDGSAMKVFVNGVQIAEEKFAGRMATDESDLVIGKGDSQWSMGEFFDGMIDEVRLWNVARSSQEIQSAMNGTLTGQEPGLVAYWNFEGDSAQDRSPHGNDGGLLDNARIVPAISASAAR